MSIIRDGHYGETEKRLTEDPIVQAMAVGLADTPPHELAHEDGTPRFEFMQTANREYRDRGGTGGGHIGAVAHALLKLLESGPPEPRAITISASTLATWAGRALSADDIERLQRAIPHSTIPDAVNEIVSSWNCQS